MRIYQIMLGCCLGALVAACTSDLLEQEADQAMALGCSSNPIYDDQGKYTGCITYVDGHRCEHDTKGLTELGCRTYCDGYPWTDPTAEARLCAVVDQPAADDPVAAD